MEIFDNDFTITNVTRGEEISGKSFKRSIIARKLQLASYTGSDTVIVTQQNPIQFLADLFAIWSLGMRAACLSSNITVSELKNIVKFCEARVVIANEDNYHGKVGCDVVCDGGLVDLDCDPQEKIILPDLENAGLILFTSGTTSIPKGVMLTLRSIVLRVKLNRQIIGKEVMHNTLCTLPLNFGHGLIGNCLTPLLNGCNLYILENSDLKTLVKLDHVLDNNKITFLSSVPAFWKLVLRLSSRPKERTLSRVHVGSAPLTAVLWRRIIEWTDCNVVNVYGTTENCNWVSGACSDDFVPQDGLVGKMWGGEAAVLDSNGIVNYKGQGKLLIKTPTLMTGYLNNVNLSKSIWQDGWYDTGDVARIDDEGCITLIGRDIYTVNKAGVKIYPEEIDALAESNKHVLDACAFGMPDPIAGELLGVVLVPCDRRLFCISKFRSWLAERLSREKLPDKVFVVDQIPKNQRGKVVREEAKRMAMETSIDI